MRWQAQEQAAASLTMQAQAMGAKPKGKATSAPPPAQDRPKRKQPLMGMDDFIKSQGLN